MLRATFTFRKIIPALVVFSFLLLAFSAPFGAADLSPTRSPLDKGEQHRIAEIDDYCKRVSQITETEKASKRIFAVLRGKPSDSWIEIRDEIDLESKANDPGWDVAAFVRSRSGKIVAANLTVTSDSGDWYSYENNCFRENESLAKLDARLNTFYGELTVIRAKWFDSDGNPIRSTTRYQALSSMESKVPGEDFIDKPPRDFKSARDLPFFSLWKRMPKSR